MGKTVFTPAFMQELKERNDIVEVASSYLSLNKRGYDYWACCPFHHEKTPSFVIHGVDQYYHCFGCGVSGNVVNLVMELESLPFPEAVRYLARRAKMEIPEADFDDERTQELKRKKDRLLSVMVESARFYLRNLYGGRADAYLEYVTRRALAPSTLKKFGIGASLDYYSLPAYLREKGFSEEEMIESGACGRNKEGKVYDFQARRLIIPIINQYDEVIAFGGRVLEPKPSGMKYVNTRDSFLFNKRKNLYNVNLLKKYKQTTSLPYVIMVEGYMDAISLYQAGFCNVVASMGTSLTPDQARLLKRFSPNVMISYDQDGAGQKADLRGLEILKEENLTVRVVLMPEGEDPDDVVRKRGKEAYQTCLDNALPFIDYKLHALEKKYDLQKAEDKREFAKAAMPVIREESSAAVREDLLKSVRDKTGFTYQSLLRDLEEYKTPVAEPAPRRVNTERQNPERSDKLTKACRFILGAALFKAPYAEGYELKEEDFSSEVHRLIVRYVRTCKAAGQAVRVSDLFELFGEDSPEFNAILDLNTDDRVEGESAQKYFADCVQTVREEILREKIAKTSAAITEEKDAEKRRALVEELTRLTKELKKRS